MATMHSAPKIHKPSVNLSKLTKGVAEFTSSQEKRLEILLDDSVHFYFLYFVIYSLFDSKFPSDLGIFIQDVMSERSNSVVDILPNRSKTVIGMSSNATPLTRKEITLPKTYTTK